MSDLQDRVAAARKDGVMLCKTRTNAMAGAPGCWMGGAPTLPPDVAWPYTSPRNIDVDIPLHFVAQINLASLPWDPAFPAMPRTGTLFFFLDPLFGPLMEFSDGAVRVIFVPGDVSMYPPREMPAKTAALKDVQSNNSDYLYAPTWGYRSWPINFAPRVSYDAHAFHGSDQREGKQLAWDLHEKETDRVFDFLYAELDVEPTGGGVAAERAKPHSMFSGPSSPGYLDEDRRVKYRKDAVALLALRDDRDIGFNFGFDEWVVFWIDPQDLARSEFDAVWAFEGIG